MTLTRPHRVPDRTKRVLVVEDWGLVADEIQRVLESLSFAVVGPFPSLDTALAALKNEEVDLALLDVNLDGVLSFPIADLLLTRGTPVIFLTGYSAHALPPRYHGVPCLEKPFGRKELAEALQAVIAPEL